MHPGGSFAWSQQSYARETVSDRAGNRVVLEAPDSNRQPRLRFNYETMRRRQSGSWNRGQVHGLGGASDLTVRAARRSTETAAPR